MAALGLLAPLAGAAWRQTGDDFNHEAIQYLKTTPTDPIVQLQKRLDSGEVQLTYNAKNGYLASVLKELGISSTTQTLVYSKTSFQRDHISPRTPRALYFNDQTYIGWVQGGEVVEIATTDPQLGANFYILRQASSKRPKFVRETYECLQCHSSPFTAGVPGHIVRSVYTRRDGQPELRLGTHLTSDQSPFEERWGGWYVTGTHGRMRHLGNGFAQGEEEPHPPNREATANTTSLKNLVDTSPYLTPHSDLVALMVFQHQVTLHNLIARATYQTKIALQYEQALNKELKRPADYRSPSTLSRVQSVCEPLVQGMLFAEVPSFPDAVAGTSGFTRQFPLQGIRDKRGRSLRDFDLITRLFRYPCSYLIYSEAFDALPPLAKDYVYRRLWEVLKGEDQSKPFANLDALSRTAILEVLRETKPDFATWKREKSG